jgi:hypothetical protein
MLKAKRTVVYLTIIIEIAGFEATNIDALATR